MDLFPVFSEKRWPWNCMLPKSEGSVTNDLMCKNSFLMWKFSLSHTLLVSLFLLPPSIHPSTHPPILPSFLLPSIYLPTTYLSHLPTCSSIVYLSTHPHVHPPIHLCIYLSIYLAIHPSIHPAFMEGLCQILGMQKLYKLSLCP